MLLADLPIPLREWEYLQRRRSFKYFLRQYAQLGRSVGGPVEDGPLPATRPRVFPRYSSVKEELILS